MTSSMIGLHEQQTPKPSAQLLPDVPPRFEHSELQVKVGNEIGSCGFIPAWVIEVLFLQNWSETGGLNADTVSKGSKILIKIKKFPKSTIQIEWMKQSFKCNSCLVRCLTYLPCVACSIPWSWWAGAEVICKLYHLKNREEFSITVSSGFLQVLRGKGPCSQQNKQAER